MRLSDRINEMQFSPIRKYNTLAREAENEGKKIYRVNIGQPDIATPVAFIKAIRKWDDDVLAYAEIQHNRKLSKNRTRSKLLFDIFKDADALDRVRFGIRDLNMSYIRNDISKHFVLIARLNLENIK